MTIQEPIRQVSTPPTPWSAVTRITSEFSNASPNRAAFKPRIRRQFPRSKNGCLSCRSRRKKCDEQKPLCRGCRRNNLACLWGRIESEANVTDQVAINQSASAIPAQSSIVYPTPNSTGSTSSTNDAHTTLPSQGHIIKTTSISKDIGELSTIQCTVGASSASLAAAEDSCHRSSQTSASEKRPTFHQPISLFKDCSKVTLLTESSPILFSKYLTETASQLVATTDSKNPLINYVLPLAHSDDLIMNCVLALGGSHLLYNEVLDPKLVAATSSHYSLALYGLHIALSENKYHGEETLRLLLATTLLCWIEVISGNSQGPVLQHLKASRQLVLLMRSNMSELHSQDLHNLWGFLLEMYSYLALLASISPGGLVDSQSIMLDPFLTSLGELNQYETNGFMLGCCHSLFELVPEISALAHQRLKEENMGTFSEDSFTRYEYLRGRLREWYISTDCSQTSALAPQQAIAATIYQNSLLIYLHASVFRQITEEATLVAELEIRAEVSLSMLLSLPMSPVAAILLWPCMIIGSCLRRERQQKILCSELLNSKYKIKTVKLAVETLRILWDDPDPKSFGPRGIDFIIRRSGLNFCMS